MEFLLDSLFREQNQESADPSELVQKKSCNVTEPPILGTIYPAFK